MINYKIALQKNSQKGQHFNHFSQVKLPILDKKGIQSMKKSLSKIRSGKLPLLHFHETNINTQEGKKNAGGSQLENLSQPEPEDNSNFAQAIEQKMNQIVHKNQMFNMDYYTSSGENFQQNIARNKEFLKEQRQKRGSILQNRKGNEPQSPKQDHNRRITENLRKRQDRAKFASKARKRTQSPVIPNSHSQSLLIHDETERRKIGPTTKGGVTNRLEKKMNELKKKLSRRKNGQESKIVTEGDAEQAKSQNLFDNIHNYLANPHRLSFDVKNVTTSSKLTSKRSALEAKIKSIQQKISSLDFTPQKEHEKTAKINSVTKAARKEIDEYGVSQWRRIEFSKSDERGKNMSMKESNFEKEVNQINFLQQRNEHSLEKYLQNQRILFDLKLMKASPNKQLLHRQFRSK